MEASLGGLMTKDEAAEYGGVTPTMLNAAASNGRIPSVKRYGKLWFQVVNSGGLQGKKFGTDKALRVLRSEVEARWKK